MDESFESRVWVLALERGLLNPRQVNECLKEFRAQSPTLQLTEILVAKGHLQPAQVAELRERVAIGDPGIPEAARQAARDPRNLLGRYVLVEELGRGGMGLVYKAWDGDLRRFVALKVLHGPWDAEDLARFRREAQSAAALRHPNIITVYEISPSDETPYIALELIEGKTLDGRKLPARKAAELVAVLARAVEAAHRKGIIHRDLKPANIMIDAEGQPRVMDFGLAKPERSSSQITMSGTVVGTPAYMSPEQAQGKAREVDHRSDIYSLGALFYELLTGQAPFRGGTPLETLTAVVNRPPIPPRKLTPSVPKPLEAVILTCLQKDKSKRYATAEALAKDLERFLKGAPVHARLPRSPVPILIGAGAALAFGITAIVLFRAPAPPPAVPPAPPPKPVVKAADRSQLDRGLRLMEEARVDLYRPGAALDRTLAKIREAEVCFTAALKADPESGAAFLARGHARSRLERLDDALPDFAEAIRRLPTSAEALLSRGRVLLERFMSEMATASWMKGEIPEAMAALRNQAREDFLKARTLSPSQNDLAYLNACLEMTAENYEKAAELAGAGIAAAERPEEFYKLRGDAQASRALAEVGSARSAAFAKGVEDYGQAIRLRANYTEAYRHRGMVLWLLGRSDDAMKDFEFVLGMNPSDSRALADIGTAHHHAGRLDQALDFFNRAIAADPRNLRALTNRGSMYLEQNRLAEGRRDLEQAVAINPLHLAAQFNLSVALLKQGEPAAALKRLDDILARMPKFSRALAVRAVIHYEGGEWQKSLDDCEKALAIDPTLESTLRPRIEACRKRLGR